MVRYTYLWVISGDFFMKHGFIEPIVAGKLRCWNLIHEKKGDDKILYPKMLLRRFSAKSMFVGVAGRPLPDSQYNGKIFMERVSKRKFISKYALCIALFSQEKLIFSQNPNPRCCNFHLLCVSSEKALLSIGSSTVSLSSTVGNASSSSLLSPPFESSLSPHCLSLISLCGASSWWEWLALATTDQTGLRPSCFMMGLFFF